MFRVISEARPGWVLGENVPGIIPMELDNVLSDLEGIGYAARPFNIGAVSVDARHRRQRIWIIGRRIDVHADSNSKPELPIHAEVAKLRRIPDASSLRLQGGEITGGNNGSGTRSDDEQFTGLHRSDRPRDTGPATWLPEPDMGRVAHGIPSRVDRLKGLGNAIVSQVAYEILKEIRKLCLP